MFALVFRLEPARAVNAVSSWKKTLTHDVKNPICVSHHWFEWQEHQNAFMIDQNKQNQWLAIEKSMNNAMFFFQIFWIYENLN